MQEMQIEPRVMLKPGEEESLLHAALSLDLGGTIAVVVPETNQRALKLLRQHGFEIVPTNRHIVRGSASTIGRRDKVYAQTSLSLG